MLNKPQCSAAWGKQGQLPWSAYQQQQQQIQSRGSSIPGYESGRCGHGVSLPQSAWPPLQVQQHQNQHPQRNNASMRPILPNGSNIKRECAGTGVFLPRRYTNPAPEPRKKAGTNGNSLNFETQLFVIRTVLFQFGTILFNMCLNYRLPNCSAPSQGSSGPQLEL